MTSHRPERPRSSSSLPGAVFRQAVLSTLAKASQAVDDIEVQAVGLRRSPGPPGFCTGNARLGDSTTGPRTVCLGSKAARPRPESADRVFSEDPTRDRLYTFWVSICGSRIPWLSHPRCPSPMGIAGRDERRGIDHSRAVARPPQALHHRDPRPSRRCHPAQRRCAGGQDRRQGDGLPSGAAAPAGQSGRQR